MIYCVWYPSGGFGHFVNAVLTLYGQDFVRPKNLLEFSPNGNSHKLDLVVPKYLHNTWSTEFDFLAEKNYCVLIDNGITNEEPIFKEKFVGATVIKICYSDHSWPIIARTMIEKAMASSIEIQLPTSEWNTNELWAQREKYFLFLRDHYLRHAWRAADEPAIYLDELLDYNNFFNKLNSLVAVDSFELLWKEWRRHNNRYIDPVEIAKHVVNQVKLNQSDKLDHIHDTWTQAVIYYYVWITFGIEVPHNDFANFFTNTDQIAELIT